MAAEPGQTMTCEHDWVLAHTGLMEFCPKCGESRRHTFRPVQEPAEMDLLKLIKWTDDLLDSDPFDAPHVNPQSPELKGVRWALQIIERLTMMSGHKAEALPACFEALFHEALLADTTNRAQSPVLLRRVRKIEADAVRYVNLRSSYTYAEWSKLLGVTIGSPSDVDAALDAKFCNSLRKEG
jgi:hypothetical protein